MQIDYPCRGKRYPVIGREERGDDVSANRVGNSGAEKAKLRKKVEAEELFQEGLFVSVICVMNCVSRAQRRLIDYRMGKQKARGLQLINPPVHDVFIMMLQ